MNKDKVLKIPTRHDFEIDCCICNTCDGKTFYLACNNEVYCGNCRARIIDIEWVSKSLDNGRIYEE